jgi:hypothetical protein
MDDFYASYLTISLSIQTSKKVEEAMFYCTT